MPSPNHRHRILYVGSSYALLVALRDGLAGLDCMVVRCPAGGVAEARSFIRSDIPYSAFLFDEVLSGACGEELMRFTLSLPHRAGTPALVVKEADDVAALAERVRRLLGRVREGEE